MLFIQGMASTKITTIEWRGEECLKSMGWAFQYIYCLPFFAPEGCSRVLEKALLFFSPTGNLHYLLQYNNERSLVNKKILFILSDPHHHGNGGRKWGTLTKNRSMHDARGLSRGRNGKEDKRFTEEQHQSVPAAGSNIKITFHVDRYWLDLTRCSVVASWWPQT